MTHAGGKELAEPLVVRPTSETIFGDMMAKWIQSHRDLPLLLNQWANVVRWEMRPRLFLRTTEFLWQEGHTAHATEVDAAQYARRIHFEVYRDFIESVLAIPILVGAKSNSERFAGAINTMTCEAMMTDGKALQMATSHEFGQNFSRAFDIRYTDAAGELQHCWTTSWGSSTRMLGGVIMAHGDDAGLRVPPKVAPIQAVIIVVKEDEGAVVAAQSLVGDLTNVGIRARLDARTETGFGRRATEWEIKGVPLRIEIGPRDVAAGQVTFVRRDQPGKFAVPRVSAVRMATEVLHDLHVQLFDRAKARLSANTFDVGSVDEAAEAAQTGFARISWKLLGEAGEQALNERAITVRCLQTPDGTVPESDDDPDSLVAITGRAY